MKKTITAILFLTATTAFAQSTLPQVRQPVELGQGAFAEGTNTRLSAEDIRVFLPWAQSSKKILTEALLQAKRMSLRERSHFIRSEVEKVVLNSGSKRYQTLMRFALNRGLLLVNELEREADSNVQGTIENQLDILTKTINISLKFYESDLDYQKRIEAGKSAVEIDNARFGYALAKELYAANINIFDASAQYRNLYKTLEMLNWDLTQDRYARNYSEVIWDIYNNLERMSELSSRNDLENVENTRKLNLLKEKAFSALDELFLAEDAKKKELERQIELERRSELARIAKEEKEQEQERRNLNMKNASSEKIEACSYLTMDRAKLECISSSETNTAKILACSSGGLTMDRAKLECISSSETNAAKIQACSSGGLTMDDKKLECINTPDVSADKIQACSKFLTMDANKLKCIKKANISAKEIESCSRLTMDSAKLACMGVK